MEMQINSGFRICKEGMENPVCLNCYNREVLEWLKDNIKHRYLISHIIRKASRRLVLNRVGINYCIICGRKGFFVCKEDYFAEVKRILQEINIPDFVIDNFSKTFIKENIYYYVG